VTCPTCRATFTRDDQAARAPFCSERCRMVDLGRWLGETYRVADEEEGSAAARLGPREDEKPEA